MRFKQISNKLLKKSGLFFLLFLLLSISNEIEGQITIGGELEEIDYAEPEQYEIGGVKVSGVNYLDKNVLVMVSDLNVGEKIKVPGEKISKAIKNLWDQGLFEDIRIVANKVEGKKIFLEIRLAERARLSGFSFEGVRKGEADKLRDKLELVNGDVVTDNLRVSARKTIKEYFRDKGYMNVDVEMQKRVDTSRRNYVKLRFDIDKNKRIKIKDINIHGNEELPDVSAVSAFKNTKEKVRFRPLNSIDKLVASTVKGVFTFDFASIADSVRQIVADDYRLGIFKKSKFIREDFEEDKQKLVDKYNSLGYRDFKILADSVSHNEDNTIDLNLYVDEGDKYYFRNIEWTGNTVYSSEQLNQVLGIEKGDVFNQEILNTKLNYDPNGTDVSSLYLDNGYLFFNVTPVEVNVENDSIDMELRVFEGEQATIDEVSISGNTRTNDHVVLRELRTKPGQLFSRNDIIRSTRELSQLKYFNSETIKPVPKPNPKKGTVDIEYQVEETSSDQIELSGGWGYGRLIGTLGLTFNNFSTSRFFDKEAWRPIPTGDGQKLRLKVQSYGKGYLSYSASFTEPWVGGSKPNSLTLSYNHSLFGDAFTSSGSSYSFQIDGVTVALGKRLNWPDDFFTLRQSLKFERYKLKNYTQIFSFGNGNGNYNTISYNIKFGRNSIDAPIFPRNGSDVSLSLELTPPYSAFKDKDYSSMSPQNKFEWLEYHKWKFKGKWFKKLVGDLVISFQSQYGFLGHYNQDIGTVPFDRYYLGGDGLTGYRNYDGREIISMRGYSNYSLTPNYYMNDNLGGAVYNKNSIELRYPISLKPSSTIYVLGFMEAGNSWLNFDKFKPFRLYRSAGVGLRVFLPMFGMLGIDWGYGFDQVPGMPDANKGQFHFTIGQNLN